MRFGVACRRCSMAHSAEPRLGHDQDQHGDHHVAHAPQDTLSVRASGRSRSPPRRAPRHRARQLAGAPRRREARARRERADASQCSGVFLPERTVLLDNKVRNHRAGYEVVTPLRLAKAMHVLVNSRLDRGAAARDAAAAGEHAGRARARRGPGARAPAAADASSSEAAKGPVRQSLELRRSRRDRPARCRPFVIEQHRGTPTACCATGRGPTPASRSTRPIRSSGTRSPRWRWCSSSCCPSAVCASCVTSCCWSALACAAPLVLGTAAYLSRLESRRAGELRRADRAAAAVRPPLECAARQVGAGHASTPRPATPIARRSSTSCARYAARRARRWTASSGCGW